MRPYQSIDLFPWILGGLLIAVAIPAGVAFMGEAPRTSPVAPTAPGLPMSASKAPEVVSSRPNTLPPMTTAPPVTRVSPQIWQCSRDGQKIFADSPCGVDATLHPLSEVNRMAAAPVARPAGYSAYRGVHEEASPYEDSAPDVAASTPTGQTVVVGVLNRREHHHPSHPHERSVRVAPAMPPPGSRGQATVRR